MANLTGLPRRLALDKIADEQALIEAVEEARKDKKPFITYIVENGIADSQVVAKIASEEFGAPLFDLSAFNIENLPTDLFDEKVVKKHHAIPLMKRGNRLMVALSDPTNIQALEDIRFSTNLNTEAVVVDEQALAQFVEKVLDSQDDGIGDIDIDDEAIEGIDVADENEDQDDGGVGIGTDDAPIVKYVNKILLDAIKGGASDIHFEPYEKAYRIRFRADGILKEVARPPISMSAKLSARVKVMSKLDISEKRIPQDGRIKLKLSKKKAIDFRVNSCPTLFGEKIVLRILDPDSAKLGIDMLGYEDEQKQLYMDALEKPQGMILVTGPTGSGKTVSLYTGLNILNTVERNISTAEDPAEINLEGINQVNVNPKVGLDFSAALKAFLRQDPDIIMVGEIRDLDTASIAIKAAQTGHMVMSTLHTNSAPETLTRLRNMGVPAFNIATSVNLIIAQRLARRLCSKCKKLLDVPDEALKEAGFTPEEIKEGLKLYGPVGCNQCSDGYKGRVGVYEVVKITDKLQRIIMEDGNSIQIADVAKEEGFNDLRASGLLKVKNGHTSLEEINRVTAS